MSLLGIDVGSTRCKGVAFATNGTILASASRAYAPARTHGPCIEQDADEFLCVVASIIRELADQTHADPIEALAISAHGETIIPVDAHHRPVGPAIMNADNRATEQATFLERELTREAIYHATGVPPHAMFAINKILWLKQHDADTFSRAARFLSIEDFILTQLGLPPLTNFSSACRTMAFDIHTKTWSDAILAETSIDTNQLAIPTPSGHLAGRLTASVASDLHLREGVAVAMGGHDQPCGAFGAGVIDTGQLADSAGTYECLAAASHTPINSPAALAYSLNSYCHVVAERFVTLAFFPAALVVNWFVEQFCSADVLDAERAGISVYEQLAHCVAERCPDPTGICVTPHLVGACTPHWDVRATGAMIGLTPNASRHHLYKAIFEGLACELAINLDAIERFVGPSPRIRVYGGNARSEFTVALRADITGHTFEPLAHSEAVCLGAAMLAGLAIGVYSSADDAIRQTVRTRTAVAPQSHVSAQYASQRQRYARLYAALKQLY